MDCQDMIQELKARASEEYKANVVRMGIPEECSIGVSNTDIRKLAKKAGRSSELAFALWRTGYHEAKLLAVLLFDHKKMKEEDIEELISDVSSWDLCNHLCKNLIIKTEQKELFIDKWISAAQTYRKRAAFILIADSVIRDKKLPEEQIEHYLRLVCEHSDDEREHVKKAVSYALREIGKKNFKFNEKALLAAWEMAETGNKAQKWIARDVIRELNGVVQAQGRERLISANTRMGKQAASLPE